MVFLGAVFGAVLFFLIFYVFIHKNEKIRGCLEAVLKKKKKTHQKNRTAETALYYFFTYPHNSSFENFWQKNQILI